AGVTILTALVSAYTGRPVRRDVAMTGELTLRGKVLAVGGIRDKVLAAHRAGIKNVVIPSQNERDLEDIPPAVRSDMKIDLVSTADEVLKVALA
ncbi:MAG: S16 family serine protease, partial [bacterium]